MNQYQPWGLLIGRLLLVYVFVMAGIGKIGNFAGTAKYMAAKGMPLTDVLLVAAIVLEVIGGLMIAVGWKARWAAWGFVGYCLATAFIFHAFWAVPADQAFMQTVLFNKNLAIAGGMLFLAFTGPGRLSLDKS